MSKTLSLAVVLCVSAAGLLAQEAKPAAPAKAELRPPRAAVIDMQEISSKSLLGKAYASRIEALEGEIKTEGTKKNAELQKMDTAIKTLQDELEKQATVLSPEAADKKRQEITKKARDRQAFLEDGQQELQRMKERAEGQAQAMNAEFQTRLKPHIEAVAKEQGVDIILTSQVALVVNNEYDISDKVIAKADEAERAAKAKAAAAAPPAPKPTPAPSPSPKP